MEIQLTEILIVRFLKNKEGLHTQSTIGQRLQFEEMNVDTFLVWKKQMLDRIQNKIKQTTIVQHFT